MWLNPQKKLRSKVGVTLACHQTIVDRKGVARNSMGVSVVRVVGGGNRIMLSVVHLVRR
jgi:hypothetical protein